MPKREVDDLSEPAVEKLKLTDEEISLLEKALMAGSSEALSSLLEHKDPQFINQVRIKGETLLYAAVKAGHRNVARILLDCGAEIGQHKESGKTPLHLAAESGFFNIVELLLRHGAEVHAEDSWGATPLDLASLRGVEDCKKHAIRRLPGEKRTILR